MEYRKVEAAMDSIVGALKERGYDPNARLYGYITENEPVYVTSHNGARALIQTLNVDMVKQYVQEMKR